MGFLPSDTWLRLVIWLAIGLVIYLAYGYRNSVMRHVEAGEKPSPEVTAAGTRTGDPPAGARETGIKE